MQATVNLKMRMKGFLDTVTRFPLTIILLVTAVIMDAIAINIQKDQPYIRLFITLIFGASIYAVFQLVYERFFQNIAFRLILMGLTLLLSAIYYLLIKDTNWATIVFIRTIVVFSLLFIAFLWIPAMNSSVNFNQSFMAVFKSFFISVFFTGVLFLGTILILRAIDVLIIPVNEKAYVHAANIIFVLLAPIYFLSLIPYYPKGRDISIFQPIKKNTIEELKSCEDEKIVNEKIIMEFGMGKDFEKKPAVDGKERVLQDEMQNKAVNPSKFLETLISYIIVPLTAVFTIILILYIIMNISGKFWTDNLMEPLLLSYSITVIIVYLLSSNMNNVFAKYFRMIFPKVLLPVVLFQTISSILKTGDVGITYGRYYMILFGVFASISALLFCILPVRKNGIIAPILMLLSFISIVPPLDAFTASKINQTSRLERVLIRNGMLEANTILPNNRVSVEDQKIIVASVRYLDSLGYTKEIKWLASYRESSDFNKVFGFTEFAADKNDYVNVSVIRDVSTPISVSGYDFLVVSNLNNHNSDFQISSFVKNTKTYTIRFDSSVKDNQAIVLEAEGKELIRFELNTIYNKFANNTKSPTVSTEEVTFTKESQTAVLTVIADTININQWNDGKDQFTNAYIMVGIK